MFRIIPLAVVLVASADAAAANYFAAPGLWGIENASINNMKVGRKKAGGTDLNEVKPTNRKNTRGEEKNEVEYVNCYLSDELEEAEEAFHRAVEHVEDAVVHAIDDEVETLFPHRKKSMKE